MGNWISWNNTETYKIQFIREKFNEYHKILNQRNWILYTDGVKIYTKLILNFDECLEEIEFKTFETFWNICEDYRIVLYVNLLVFFKSDMNKYGPVLRPLFDSQGAVLLEISVKSDIEPVIVGGENGEVIKSWVMIPDENIMYFYESIKEKNLDIPKNNI
jgi:hypothetical protein